jgi:hypothetical protein
MSGISFRSIRLGLATLVCVLALMPALAFATNDSADTAQDLTATASSDSQQLIGSPGGAYRYYRIAYQGSNAPVVVTLTFQPGYGNTGKQGFGFNLYGPNSLSFAGVPLGSDTNVSTAQYTLSTNSAMSVLIQVYNYTAGMQVGYTLNVAGLSGGTSGAIVGQNNTAPGTSIPISTINAAIGGSILGSAAGAFQYYSLSYPGGKVPLTITMNASPAYNASGDAYGFNVYQPSASGAVLVARGTRAAQDVNSMAYTATVSQQSAATLQLQIVNYWPGVTINYGVTTTGAAGPAPQVSGNLDAGHAVVLNSAQPGATETIVGNRGGAFNYFLVTYPGANSTLTLSITYSDLGAASDSTLGFKIYDGTKLIATINPSPDGTGTHSGWWTYTDPAVHTFGVQVFNYADGASASYVINQVGAN